MITITKDSIYHSPFSLKRTDSDSDMVEVIKAADIIYSLGDEIELGEDVTFKNLFDIIIFHKEIFNTIFKEELGGLLIEDFIEDYEKDFSVEFNKIGFKLRLSWQSEVYQYDDEIEYLDYTSFEAFGRLYEEDEEDYPVSLSYVSLCEIREKNIFLDHTFELYDEENYTNDVEPLFKAHHRDFTLYNIFSSILREISFYGTPEERDVLRDELEKKSKEFLSKEHFEDMIRWDDISEEIDEMMSQELIDKESVETFWDKLYPKQKNIGTSTKSKVDSAIIALSKGADIPLEQQLQEAHDSEDYETAGKIKKLIDKRDKK